jgi:hypothetical protein
MNFRQLLCIVLIAAGFASEATAQKGWNVGLRVTPLASWLVGHRGDAENDTIYRPNQAYGVYAGVAGGYSFSNYTGVSAQFLYGAQGQNYESTAYFTGGDSLNILTEIRARYIKLPILFKINTNAERKFSAFFEVGPSFDILTSVTERSTDTRNTHLPFNFPNTYNPSREEISFYPSRENTFNYFNLSAVLALGVDIKLRYNLKMYLAARFDYGFLDIENKDATYSRDQDGIRTEYAYYKDPANRPFYNPRRSSVNPMTLGLTLGFTYLFIDKLHY